ncbi:MAG: alpha/beta hydrolase family protein [Phycisphaerales bacterium]
MTSARRSSPRAATVCLGALAAILLAGCSAPTLVVQPAAPKALALVHTVPETGVGPAGGASAGGVLPVEEAWRDPATWPRRFGRGRGGTMGLVEEMEGPVVAMRQGDEQRREIEREMLEDIAKLMTLRGRGWLRGAPLVTVKGEGAGAFVFTTDRNADPKRVKSPTSPAMYFKFTSGSRDDTGEVVRMQRTWFAYYDPFGYGPYDQVSTRPSPAGVVILIPGIFGTPVSQVNQVLHTLRSRGWAVLRMLSQPSRFTENAAFVLAEGAGGQGGRGSAEVESFARSIADTLGDRAAECAYAVEDTMSLLVQRRPMLAGAPRVALGMSGGAMVMPTVVARNPNAYAAAVLIAGGVDFLSVALESNYSEWIDALRFRRPGGAPLTSAQRGQLVRAYRRAAPLDSLYTAASLRGKPVLMLHGTQDRAVPAHLGDELWEVAGRPERWTFDAGHEFLFFWLPRHTSRLADWVDQHAGPGREAGSTPAESAAREPRE